MDKYYEPDFEPGNQVAPPGSLFVCLACGKTSKTKYGLAATNGWDESCMLNCQLFEESRLVYSGVPDRIVRVPKRSKISKLKFIGKNVRVIRVLDEVPKEEKHES